MLTKLVVRPARLQQRVQYATFVSQAITATEHALVTLHTFTGLPWWATILSTTAVLRLTTTLPLVIHQQHVLARLERVRPELLEWRAALQHRCVVRGRRENRSVEEVQREFEREFRDIRRQLFREHRCSPWRASLPIYLHVPLWINLSLALRNLCQDPTLQLSLASEGLLWIPDLTLSDSTLALPILLGLSNLVAIEVGRATSTGLSKRRAGKKDKVEKCSLL